MKTKWTKDIVSYIENDTLVASVPFTWNLPILRNEILWGNLFYKRVLVGGPALALMPDYFNDMEIVTVGKSMSGWLQRHNPLATRTTIGCPNSCGFCAVPKIEGAFVELEDWPDLPIICDNNLLKASQAHFDKVCDRLEKHDWCDFNQGLDCRLLTDYHAERLARIPKAIVRLALDSVGVIDQWENAFTLLRKHKFPKNRLRSYVIAGFRSDENDAWLRCNFVDKRGVLPCPQWYHPLNATEYNAVLPCHKTYGWTKGKRNRLMQYWYQHRGTPL